MADRLISQGILVRQQPALVSFRRDVRYWAASEDEWATCSWPAIRLSAGLREQRLSRDDVVLLAFVDAADLTSTLLEDPELRPRQTAVLAEAIQGIPPLVQPVVAAVRTAIGKAVLTHRT